MGRASDQCWRDSRACCNLSSVSRYARQIRAGSPTRGRSALQLGPRGPRNSRLRQFLCRPKYELRLMKLKEVFYGLGFRPGLREYPFDISSFELPKEGVVEFARWQHPSARRRDRAGGGFRLTQVMVDTHRAFLDAGDVAIDIGAHTGDSSIPIALAVGVKGAVFALEPNLYAYKVLLANCALNRTKTNIFPLNIAATPEDGSFEFEYSDPGFCNGGFHAGIDTWKHAHFFKLKVTGRHLPNFLSSRFPAEAARVRYIKIDTEGFDRAVAASLRSILIEKKPYLKT